MNANIKEFYDSSPNAALNQKSDETRNMDNNGTDEENDMRVISLRNEETFKTFLMKDKEAFLTNWKNPPACAHVANHDFERLRELGEGAFGKVYLVRKLTPQSNNEKGGGGGGGHLYASKVLNKNHVIKSKCKDHVLMEKRILQCIRYPFLIQLYYYYKDATNLYFILEYVEHGDMFNHLKELHRFEESIAKFYAAQVVLAFEYIHYNDLIYRDLKPENLLIDLQGYLKITDFGFSKYMGSIGKKRTYTICGTPEYMAPEIISQNKGYDYGADWWALGVLIHEMCLGYTPFRGSEENEIFRNILDYRMTKLKCGQIGQDCIDLIDCLLRADYRKRYGCLKNGITDITHHPWFYRVDWEGIYAKAIPSPYKPVSKHNSVVIEQGNIKEIKHHKAQPHTKHIIKNMSKKTGKTDLFPILLLL